MIVKDRYYVDGEDGNFELCVQVERLSSKGRNWGRWGSMVTCPEIFVSYDRVGMGWEVYMQCKSADM